jgi:hypothetical protein
MKPNPGKGNKATNGGNNGMIKPPIPLNRPEEDKKSPEDTLKFKLLSTPSKPKDSPTYEVVVNVFRNGTPEEYIKAVIAIDKVCKGQGIDKEAKQKYVMARRILQGEALTSFNNAANDVWSNEDQDGLPLDQGEETLENFDLVMLKVAGAVFPIRSYLTQKQAMRRFMRKPKDMKIREYVDRLLEINRYLAFFPTNTGERATVLPDDEIMDILMYGIPNTWQKRIVELNFDAQAHTPNEFIEMCERISYGESFNEGTTSKPKVAFQEQNNKGKNNKKKPPTANPNGSKYCPLHKTNGHDAKECKVLLAQVKKMSASYESKTSFHSNKRQKTNYNKSKSEQMFSFMVNAFKAANNKEKSSTSNDKKRKANENYAFDDDIFDEFNLDDDVSNKDEANTDPDE